MPPQPGMFALPYASTHKPPQGPNPHYHNAHPIAGPSRVQDDPKREKKRKDISGKVGKEMLDRRDEGRHFTENISALHSAAMQLASRPETHPLYNLRLYPISLERSALLAQHATAYEEERERVEEEWRKGRRRAREEKEGEGTVNDATLDAQSRSHITRKLRNKVGTSPPPTPLALRGENLVNGSLGSNTPITTGPFTNPHSLSVDELPSPFPFPLTAVTLTNPSSGAGGNSGANGSRRRAKGAGLHSSMVGVGGLGKSIAMLGPSKEADIEADLMEIRRGSKRRRAAG
ncbi:hypothetical protein DFJ58DRAFT_778836, partial [Suillus subalutaceus]|uniref:uncharacterized protein n=1 Tax=Suillus subalutaceus TaxID=48586 RepID=UPI001B8718A4